MSTTTRDSKWSELIASLAAGTAGFALLWAAGASEQGYLAYLATGLAWSGRRGRRGRER